MFIAKHKYPVSKESNLKFNNLDGKTQNLQSEPLKQLPG